MNREEAYQTVTTLISNKNLVKHHLATEAAMRGLAEYFAQKGEVVNIEDWGMVGLLHDADYELTKDDADKHTIVLEEKIGNKLKPEVMYAIKAHNYKSTGATPKTHMDWAIWACDELTGLIIASALIHPDKKLSSLDVNFIMKRFNSPSFSKAVDRNQIKDCGKELGIPLNEFIAIVLTSMVKISKELGL